MNQRFYTALGVYAALMALAFFLLHGIILKGTLLLLGLLVAKTSIAWKAGW